MSRITFTVRDFSFPADLKDDFAAFRLVVALRYTDSNGKLVDLTDVIPGVANEEYWECEWGNRKKPNFVRATDGKKPPKRSFPRVDMSLLSESRREAIFEDVSYKSLERVTVKIFDVEKDGKWDKFLREALKITFDIGIDMLKAGTAITVGNILAELKKTKEADRSEIEKKFNELMDARAKAGKQRLIWEHSADIEGLTSGDPFAVTGNSQLGVFTVTFDSEIK